MFYSMLSACSLFSCLPVASPILHGCYLRMVISVSLYSIFDLWHWKVLSAVTEALFAFFLRYLLMKILFVKE